MQQGRVMVVCLSNMEILGAGAAVTRIGVCVCTVMCSSMVPNTVVLEGASEHCPHSLQGVFKINQADHPPACT